jgi:prepilin-type N-terminal cleavage/methylation domain-containing protein
MSQAAQLRASCAQRGLSLIEVIVALVVISGFGAALFVWAGQTLQTATRAATLQSEVELERNITELASSLNPSDSDSGELRTPSHVYRWQASVAREPADQLRQPLGQGMYQIAAYTVRFTVTALDETRTSLVSERVVAGYKQVRQRQGGPPGVGDIGAPR